MQVINLSILQFITKQDFFYTFVGLNIAFIAFVFISRYLTKDNEHHHDEEE